MKSLLLLTGFLGLLANTHYLSAETDEPVGFSNQAPQINGLVEGSLQTLSANQLSLNSGSIIMGDLLVRGTPDVVLNGNPDFQGTIVTGGSAAPSGWKIYLNSGSKLRNLRSRVDGVAPPPVSSPPQPQGNRWVWLNPGQTPGNFATIRGLGLNSSYGPLTVPPGVYGEFTSNANTSFILGRPDGDPANPDVYVFDRITINSNGAFHVAGPVRIILRWGANINGPGPLGNPTNHAWLKLEIHSGGIFVNSGAEVFAHATAPASEVYINGQWTGGLVANRITVNSGGALRLRDGSTGPQPEPNHPPVAEALSLEIDQRASVLIPFAATDPDGDDLELLILSTPSHGTLADSAGDPLPLNAPLTPAQLTSATYLPDPAFHGTDSFTYRASDGELHSEAATVTITVNRVNLPPVVELTTPLDAQSFPLGEPIVLAATASDSDGTVAKVDLFANDALVGEITTAPFTTTFTPSTLGSFIISVRASDNDGATASSAPISITVFQPNRAPNAQAVEASTNQDTAVAVNLLASDPDEDPLTFEILTQPANGTLTSDLPGLTYTPVAGFHGTDSFTYRASDGELHSEAATVTITVNRVNLPPVVELTTPLDAQSFPLGEPIVLAATASDSDGTVAKVEFFANDALVGEITTAPFATIFTPLAPGSFVITARATDTDGATVSSASISIAVFQSNHPPEAVSLILETSMNQDLPVSLQATDPDGDEVSYEITVSPTNGTLNGDLPNLVYSPNSNFTGLDQFEFRAFDGSLFSSVATISINVLPVANGAHQVTVGPDLIISVSEFAMLTAQVTLDDEPIDAAIHWKPVGSVDGINITDPHSASTSVSFTYPGNYSFRAEATHASTISSAIQNVLVLPNADMTSDTPVTARGSLFWMTFLRFGQLWNEPEYGANFLEISGPPGTDVLVEWQEVYLDSASPYGDEPRHVSSYPRSEMISIGQNSRTSVSISDFWPQFYTFHEGLALPTAVKISSSNNISIHAIAGIESDADGSVVYPIQLLGREYVILTYGNSAVPVPGRPNSKLLGTQFAVVATADETEVRITPTASTPSHPADFPANEEIVVTLQAGEVFRLINEEDPGADYSGSRISASRQVAVFAGHVLTNVPSAVTAADHLFEQVPPVGHWGNHYISYPLASRENGDTYRILAGPSPTRVALNGQVFQTLQPFEFLEIVLDRATTITSDHSVLVALFANGTSWDDQPGDPFLTYLTPVSHFSKAYAFSTPRLYDNWGIRDHDENQHFDPFDASFLTLIVQTSHSDRIRLDEELLPATIFSPIGSSGFSGATIPVAVASNFTVDSDVRFGAMLYGFADATSYVFRGGASVGTVQEVSLSLLADSLKALSGTQHTVVANLFSSAGAPIGGVALAFDIQGPNPQSGSVTTNAFGQANITWLGQQTGTDQVTVSLGEESQSLSIEWLPFLSHNNLPPSVNAGEEIVTTSTTITLHGDVQDDGLPADSPLTSLWKQTGGLGVATISDSSSQVTDVDLPYLGTYYFRLLASDGEFAASDFISVRRHLPPVIEAFSYHYYRGLPGAIIPLAVKVADFDGEIASVEYFMNGESLGFGERHYGYPAYLPGGIGLEYVINWQAPSEPGDHYFSAVVTDMDGATALLEPQQIRVLREPVLEWLAPPSPAQMLIGETYRFSLQITDPDWTRSGSPNLLKDGLNLGQFLYNWSTGMWFFDYTAETTAAFSFVATILSDVYSEILPQAFTYESEALPVVVTLPPAPLISLSSASGFLSPPGEEIVLTASYPDSPHFQGLILSFYADDVFIGHAGSNPATISFTPPSEGRYSFVVRTSDAYGRDLESTALEVLVAIAPEIVLLAPPDGAVFDHSVPLNIDVEVTAGTAPISSIQLWIDGVVVDTLQGDGIISFQWLEPSGGKHRIHATVTDANDLLAASDTAAIFIRRPLNVSLPTPPDLTAESTDPFQAQLQCLDPGSAPPVEQILVERSTGVEGEWLEISLHPALSTEIFDDGLNEQTYYRYRIAYVDELGQRGPYGNEAAAVTLVNVPRYAVIDLGRQLQQDFTALRFIRPEDMYAQAGGVIPGGAVIDLLHSQAVNMTEDMRVLLRHEEDGVLRHILWSPDGPAQVLDDKAFYGNRLGHDGRVLGFVDHSRTLGSEDEGRLTLAEKKALAFMPNNWLFGQSLRRGGHADDGERLIDVRAAAWTPGVTPPLTALTGAPKTYYTASGQLELDVPKMFHSVNIAWDSTIAGLTLGANTWLDLVGLDQTGLNQISNAPDFEGYGEMAFGHGARWQSLAEWDSVRALKDPNDSRALVESMLMLTNPDGTVMVGPSAVPELGQGATNPVRTIKAFGLNPNIGDPDLAWLRGFEGATFARADGMDTTGNVVGLSMKGLNSGNYIGVRWPVDKLAPEQLPLPYLDDSSKNAYAKGINAAGDRVVGYAQGNEVMDTETRFRAGGYMWMRNAMAGSEEAPQWEGVRLNDYVPENWNLLEAISINNGGLILAQARVFEEGAWSQPRAVLLVPIEVVVPQINSKREETGKLVDSSRRLKVAQWENAWSEQFGNLLSNFIDLDPDRFYVRIPKIGDSASIKVILSTTDRIGETLSEPIEIEMMENTENSSMLISESHLLVADDPDNEMIGARAPEEYAGRTHKIGLFNKLKVKIEISGSSGEVGIEIPAPGNTNVVRLRAVILNKEIDGAPPISETKVWSDLFNNVVPHYAQANVVVLITGVTTENPPSDVNLDDGLEQADKNYLPDEVKSIIENLGTLSIDDITIFYVPFITQGVPGDSERGAKGFALFDSAFSNSEDKPYTSNIFIGADTKDDLTTAHELGHILTDGWHLDEGLVPFHAVAVMRRNLMYGGAVYGRQVNGTIGDPKRLWDSQIMKIMSSEHVK